MKRDIGNLSWSKCTFKRKQMKCFVISQLWISYFISMINLQIEQLISWNTAFLCSQLCLIYLRTSPTEKKSIQKSKTEALTSEYTVHI